MLFLIIFVSFTNAHAYYDGEIKIGRDKPEYYKNDLVVINGTVNKIIPDGKILLRFSNYYTNEIITEAIVKTDENGHYTYTIDTSSLLWEPNVRYKITPFYDGNPGINQHHLSLMLIPNEIDPDYNKGNPFIEIEQLKQENQELKEQLSSLMDTIKSLEKKIDDLNKIIMEQIKVIMETLTMLKAK